MGFSTSRSSGRLGIALVAAVILFGTAPATALPVKTSPEPTSIQDELERFTAALEAQSDRAIGVAAQAAQRAIEDNQDTLSDLESQWAEQLETFRALLNEQKAILDKIGENAAAAFDAWTQATKDSWKGSWQEAWAEMHRSALEALDRLQEWLERHSASDEPIPI